jgi:hypothetical protein
VEGFRSSSDLVRFAGFELDPHAGELRKDDGTRIRLQEQPLQILRILLEQPGRIITREELRQSAAAIESYEKGIALGGMLALQKAFIGNVHGRSGTRRRRGKFWTNWSIFQGVHTFPFMASVFVFEGLGMNDLAIEALEKAYKGRETTLVFLKIWPHFDQLRQDPRFQDVERRVGFRT